MVESNEAQPADAQPTDSELKQEMPDMEKMELKDGNGEGSTEVTPTVEVDGGEEVRDAGDEEEKKEDSEMKEGEKVEEKKEEIVNDELPEVSLVPCPEDGKFVGIYGDILKVEVVQNDITRETVDAITNAANGNLAHGGGVAGAISSCGGPEI